MNGVTDKTWFLYFKGFQIWVTEAQSEAVRKVMDSGKEYLDIDGRRIKLDDCALLKGEDNDRMEKIKCGNWMCAWGQWHSKDENCGHDTNHRT